jgi:hypothetical protein
MDPPIRSSGLKCINAPSRLPEGTHTSWQITCRSVYHHLPGPDSSAIRGVGSILKPLALVVHQQLLCHLHIVGSRLGPSQRRSKEYIHRFCNKRNVIPEVHDKSIVMFFKKGLMNSSLIRKLTVKNHRMLEQMFSITNRYALAEKATIDTRE